MVGLISRVPAAEPSYCLLQVVRVSTVERLVEAGLIVLGAEEVVPEYGDGRQGWVWVPGRVGRRFTVTEAGRVTAGAWLPL